jgi:glycosyltransferase involved in cell wall biosynthesis
MLQDKAFRARVRNHGFEQAKLFTWNETAKRAIAAWERIEKSLPPLEPILESSLERSSNSSLAPTWQTIAKHTQGIYSKLIAKISTFQSKLTEADLQNIAMSWAHNEEVIDCFLRRTILPEHLIFRLEGPFDSTYSLALVNREMARALQAQGHQVALHSTDGPQDFEPNPTFLASNRDLSSMHKQASRISGFDANVTSRNLYPPRVSNMHSRLNTLHAYGWEESGFPLEWVDEFNMNLQGMTVMSNHVAKIMVDHGVTVPIEVSGLGVDHWQTIEPDQAYKLSAKAFRFLHVSSCFPRKGVDVMLRAYGRAFRSTDDVSLVIKTFANPHNEIHKWLNEARQGDALFPDVQIIEDDLTDGQLKALYEQCHALVAPSRAEGFGLPMAEAILSGLAVITTGWGGQTDFCNPNTAWLVDYQMARAQTHFGLYASAWAEPNEQHLSELMYEVYQLPQSERQVRIDAGQKLLISQFSWANAATRVVQATRRIASEMTTPDVRIGWVSTWHTPCGIATYSKHLTNNLTMPITVLAAQVDKPIEPDKSKTFRCWSAGEDDTLAALSHTIDVEKLNCLVIQFNYGFFHFETFTQFLNQQIDAGRKVVLMLHATIDPLTLPHKKLSIILPALKRCDHLLVHSINDLNHLKVLGLERNVTLFPHGVLDYVLPAKLSKPDKHEFVVGSYGFFLPHKGLLELIEAIGILRKQGVSVRLLMVNAAYPITESKVLIKKAQAKIAELRLSDCITMCVDFLSDTESLQKLAHTDLIVYPYQDTAESASGAVRYGMATGKPVAVTPISIFEDLKEATFTMPGSTPKDLAQGILAIQQSLKSQSEKAQTIKQAASTWKLHHSFAKLGTRLSGILQATSRVKR